ncbi:MarR family transcriptional regulator [Cryobacterium sp. TMT1-21]|uniref:MarR family transcriptional regulator n=1 Tax=Cryobacterium shii TaxID=1259235 RepID=A0AAQ2HEK3_9MICO|nr:MULTISPECIES: MarR family transcriptional regulator [Cryobacterium]TFC43173.1 MarR family transcriptional regulator [Cryobacterium shii]TFC86236.1 MarR family transcriptional regulator [Cryobacterium sp. TmT2-59]TFD12678.1 MarR family transcriptional regulator [Cryobacterium sp. TMT1-21]TFD17405.1 MarR family transcriptional regulator [Cryobacterium sp. TMT4-10]TFD20818.1 MarR family transcriptional regulator [Cryobacterium sp. TMT2-23]
MSTTLLDLLGDLITVNHRVTRLAAQAANGTESPAVWRTLSVLRQTGPIRLGELAVRSRVSQPTATKLVSHLAERGWAERLADPLDARAARTRVTASGEAALAAWRTELATALLPLFSDLPAADVEVLERAIAILRERVDAGEPAPPAEPGDAAVAL